MERLHAAILSNPALFKVDRIPFLTMLSVNTKVEASISAMMKSYKDIFDLSFVTKFFDMNTNVESEIYVCKLAVYMFKLKKELSDYAKNIIIICLFYS